MVLSTSRQTSRSTRASRLTRTSVRNTLRNILPLTLSLAMGLSLFGAGVPAAAAPPSDLRPVEYLTRGLVAAQAAGGIFLSWRFLGDEPDGLSWNVYRKDGDADFAKIATIEPRDVQPESDYDTNPGIVKEDVTPSNYTDPDGVAHLRLRGRPGRRRRRGRAAGHERAHAVGPGRAGRARPTEAPCTTSR